MKSNFVRASIAGALLLALAACGGTEQFTISGTIQGLKNNGLVLANAGKTISVPANATTFSFPDTVEYGNTYDVTVTAEPAHQDCTVFRGDGTAGQMAQLNILIDCRQNEYTVGGKVTGLTVDDLVLANGSNGTVLLKKTMTTYELPPVKDGDTYGVTVLKQPAGLFCTVANGVGVMGEAKVTNVDVTCQPAT
ncbi:MAG TPA: hypothetical protein VGE60_04465 [Telluria sp.]